jgi:hypothetical protein
MMPKRAAARKLISAVKGKTGMPRWMLSGLRIPPGFNAGIALVPAYATDVRVVPNAGLTENT